MILSFNLLIGTSVRSVRSALAIVLIYDITKKETFNRIADWLTFIEKSIINNGDDEVVIILVGNKKDLNEKREVTFKEGLEMSKLHGLPFFETSAKTNINIDNLFDFIARTHIDIKE